jgi:uncharacterized protein with PIN domain
LDRALTSNPFGYVTKPLEEKDLIIAIDMAVNRDRERKRSVAILESLKETIGKLEATISEVRMLHGILPICAHCKKIRKDEGDWIAMEKYISEHSEAQFSHGVCPDCRNKYYLPRRNKPENS